MQLTLDEIETILFLVRQKAASAYNNRDGNFYKHILELKDKLVLEREKILNIGKEK